VEEAQECVTAIDNTQLKLGSKFFTFDAVYDGGSRQEVIYDDCVRELVTGCFSGYNATVLAYGQTGSGKTHTMGSSSVDTVLLEEQGIIPRAVRQMFEEIQHRKLAQPGWSCKVLVSFLEIYNEEFKDLLDTNLLVGTKGKNSISLREGPNGSILVVGASEESVSSYEEMLQCLEKGTVCRSVGSTSMNAVSSRSHAIFTVTIEQTSIDTDTHSSHENADGHKSAEASDASTAPLTPTASSMTSKFHFVDLAGSERAKKTGAEGGRLKEGININYGLLVLGNVISALGDEARKGSHVPYRDSKLTRMLQDSIGGNSRTLMIACISPADSNFAESYNTITYANRARNIKNKPIVNRDARDAKMAAMMQQVARLKAERDAALKRAGLALSDLEVGVPGEDAPGAAPGMGAMGQGKTAENDKLKAELSKRQQDNVKLLLRLEEAELQVTTLEAQLKTHAQKMAQVQTERDTFRHRLELATGVPAGPLDGSTVLEEKEVQLAAMREEVARANESMHEMQLKVRRLESDVQKDQSVFSVQNKKIHFLSKKNQALKMENEGLARMSMSPMVKSLIQRSPPPSASAGGRVTPAAGEEEAKQQQQQQGRKDSPTVMGHFRKKLDSLLSEHDDKERSDPLVLSEEELAELDSDEEGPEILEVPEAGDVDAVLAEEEERRWRQGLLQTEVELRDWTSALDSKEKLLLQLEKEKTENEKLKMNYEVRMAAYEEAVKTAKGVEEAALSKLKQFEAVKGKDEDEIARLTKEHQQRVKELEQKMAKLKREEKEYTRWLQQRDKDQQRINALQAEIEKGKQSKNDLLRKMKEDENKYRDWRERHHREVQQLKRSAQKAEYTIRKLEAENKQFKAVLRRREEEKAALQREKREVALANASLAKSDKLSCATSLAGDGGGKGAACRSASALQVKTRSQVAHAERVDRFKMNRAKAKLKHMLEEYGQRGKLQAELARLKAENKTLVPETKELQVEKDTLELQVERSIVFRTRTSEAWGEEKFDSGTHVHDGHEGAADLQEAKNRLDHLRDMLEEKHTKLDYNRDRISAIDKKLKALPDFESSSGLWADDDTMEVPEAYAPIREANGAEAKFLLRFLFKKAAIFRESDLRARHQIELQRVAIEEQMRERDQAVGSMRRAELEFDQRCTQLQKQHQDKSLPPPSVCLCLGASRLSGITCHVLTELLLLCGVCPGACCSTHASTPSQKRQVRRRRVGTALATPSSTWAATSATLVPLAAALVPRHRAL
jgi:kinesin family member 21